MEKRTVPAIFLMLHLIFVSCSNDKNDFRKAQEANTIQSYEEFIRKYPESGFAERAKSTIDSMRYEVVASQNNLEAFEIFVREYPGSKFRAQVEERIRQLMVPDVELRYRLKDADKVSGKMSIDTKGNWTFTLPQKGLLIGALAFEDPTPCRITILTKDKTLLAEKEGIKAKDKSGTIWVSREVELDGEKVKAFFVSR